MSRGVKEQLRGVVPDSLLDFVPRSFDVIGSKQKAVVIIEVPEEIRVRAARAVERRSSTAREIPTAASFFAISVFIAHADRRTADALNAAIPKATATFNEFLTPYIGM